MATKSTTPPIPTPTDEQLAALRAENERLRAELDGVAQKSQPRTTAVARTIGAVALITIAVILAPSTIVASWAATEVSNTARFVESLAPLSRDATVRTFIGEKVTTVIEDSIDIDGFTATAFEGLGESLKPPAAAALAALAPAAADGIRQLLADTVQRLVNAPAFQKVWDESLQLGHSQIVAILENDSSRAVVVSDTGEVGLNLEPIVAEVKQRLVDAEFPLAASIPTVDTVVTIATIENIGQVRLAYRVLMFSTTALPWITLVALIGGILLAPSRPRAMLGAGLALVLVVGSVLIALTAVRAVLSAEAVRFGAPPAVTQAVYDALTTQVTGASTALLILGALLAAAGFLIGRSRGAVSIRRTASGLATSLHGSLDRHGLGSARVGAVVHRARFAIWTAVGVVAASVLVLSRPLTPAVVGTILLWVAVIALVYAILARPRAVVVD